VTTNEAAVVLALSYTQIGHTIDVWQKNRKSTLIFHKNFHDEVLD
jgi:hypothetical protein